MADSAQVPRIQAKYTADSSQVPRVHVQVLGHGRGVPEWKLHEEESKYTKATAEVYLLSSDCNVAMLPRTMQPELELFEVDGIGDDAQCVNIGWCSPILALVYFSPKNHCFQL